MGKTSVTLSVAQ